MTEPGEHAKKSRGFYAFNTWKKCATCGCTKDSRRYKVTTKTGALLTDLILDRYDGVDSTMRVCRACLRELESGKLTDKHKEHGIKLKSEVLSSPSIAVASSSISSSLSSTPSSSAVFTPSMPLSSSLSTSTFPWSVPTRSPISTSSTPILPPGFTPTTSVSSMGSISSVPSTPMSNSASLSSLALSVPSTPSAVSTSSTFSALSTPCTPFAVSTASAHSAPPTSFFSSSLPSSLPASSAVLPVDPRPFSPRLQQSSPQVIDSTAAQYVFHQLSSIHSNLSATADPSASPDLGAIQTCMHILSASLAASDPASKLGVSTPASSSSSSSSSSGTSKNVAHVDHQGRPASESVVPNGSTRDRIRRNSATPTLLTAPSQVLHRQ